MAGSVGAGSGEVLLADGGSASTHFRRVLAASADGYPGIFSRGLIPSAAEFKRGYPELLPQFEAARADSEERCQIAASLAAGAQASFVWSGESGEVPLREHVSGAFEPLETESRQLGGNRSLVPVVPHNGSLLVGSQLEAFAVDLFERGSASASVAHGIGWVVETAGSEGFDLRGRRVVVLGAGAELAPTRHWLAGGAEVLWLDVSPPSAALLESDRLSGTLHWVPDGADLLRDPGRIRATIEVFAGDDRALDLGLYAYAPGRTREWRLTGTMNAIVDALPVDIVRTITMLVSPTTCGVLTTDDEAAEDRRRARRPKWQAAADRLGLLGKGPGHAQHGETRTNRGIVPIQGASYQAAQLLGKLMAAEAWATAERPFHVSANTAGISLTESLRHPVFDTAFAGAGAFGIETFIPATTASLNGLLALRDWLDPKAPGSPDFAHLTSIARARALSATRVHGGIYELPYPIEPALRVATALGVAKRPSRLGSLLRRS